MFKKNFIHLYIAAAIFAFGGPLYQGACVKYHIEQIGHMRNYADRHSYYQSSVRGRYSREKANEIFQAGCEKARVRFKTSF